MRALILLALLSTALAAPENASRIVGGTATTVENYPYMANVQYSANGVVWSRHCGGILLTNFGVLSAAHCFREASTYNVRVLLGTSFSNRGGTTHAVSQIIRHELFDNPYLDNNLAILKLSSPAIFSESVQPARIAGPNFNLPDGTEVHVAGWGALGHGSGFPTQLLHVAVNIINQQQCASRYAFLRWRPGFEHWPVVSDGMLCAGILDIGGKDACQGDSGGPLAYDGDIIVGVSSWGFRCGDFYYPGVYVRVSHYTDWIVRNAS